MFRGAVTQEKRVERLENIVGAHPGADRDGKSLPGVLVQNSQHLIAATIAELVVNEIDAPDVVWMGWPQSND